MSDMTLYMYTKCAIYILLYTSNDDLAGVHCGVSNEVSHTNVELKC